MEVIRRIGKHDILVESSEPFGVYFEQSDALQLTGGDSVALSRSEMLGMLASGDDYLPLSLHWELLDRCNFSCPFCYIVGHSSRKLVRLAEIRHQLAELVAEGLLFCTLTGGEVTLHPDFKDIFRFLKESGVVVQVFTNGSALDDDLVELFRSHPPEVVEISLYSVDNERLRRIYGVHSGQGASQVLANVLRLKHAGVSVTCKTFLNTITISDVQAVSLWCRDNGIEHYSSSEILNAYDGADLSCYALETPRVRERDPEEAVCLPCGVKNYGGAINASFAIYPCQSIQLTDCTFDLRQLGVTESLRRMRDFMRRFQDTRIRGSGGGHSGCASCMGYAKPVRNEAGEIVHFSQP